MGVVASFDPEARRDLLFERAHKDKLDRLLKTLAETRNKPESTKPFPPTVASIYRHLHSIAELPERSYTGLSRTSTARGILSLSSRGFDSLHLSPQDEEWAAGVPAAEWTFDLLLSLAPEYTVDREFQQKYQKELDYLVRETAKWRRENQRRWPVNPRVIVRHLSNQMSNRYSDWLMRSNEWIMVRLKSSNGIPDEVLAESRKIPAAEWNLERIKQFDPAAKVSEEFETRHKEALNQLIRHCAEQRIAHNLGWPLPLDVFYRGVRMLEEEGIQMASAFPAINKLASEWNELEHGPDIQYLADGPSSVSLQEIEVLAPEILNLGSRQIRHEEPSIKLEEGSKKKPKIKSPVVEPGTSAKPDKRHPITWSPEAPKVEVLSAAKRVAEQKATKTKPTKREVGTAATPEETKPKSKAPSSAVVSMSSHPKDLSPKRQVVKTEKRTKPGQAAEEVKHLKESAELHGETAHHDEAPRQEEPLITGKSQIMPRTSRSLRPDIIYGEEAKEHGKEHRASLVSTEAPTSPYVTSRSTARDVRRVESKKRPTTRIAPQASRRLKPAKSKAEDEMDRKANEAVRHVTSDLFLQARARFMPTVPLKKPRRAPVKGAMPPEQKKSPKIEAASSGPTDAAIRVYNRREVLPPGMDSLERQRLWLLTKRKETAELATDNEDSQSEADNPIEVRKASTETEELAYAYTAPAFKRYNPSLVGPHPPFTVGVVNADGSTYTRDLSDMRTAEDMAKRLGDWQVMQMLRRAKTSAAASAPASKVCRVRCQSAPNPATYRPPPIAAFVTNSLTDVAVHSLDVSLSRSTEPTVILVPQPSSEEEATARRESKLQELKRIQESTKWHSVAPSEPATRLRMRTAQTKLYF